MELPVKLLKRTRPKDTKSSSQTFQFDFFECEQLKDQPSSHYASITFQEKNRNDPLVFPLGRNR